MILIFSRWRESGNRCPKRSLSSHKNTRRVAFRIWLKISRSTVFATKPPSFNHIFATLYLIIPYVLVLYVHLLIICLTICLLFTCLYYLTNLWLSILFCKKTGNSLIIYDSLCKQPPRQKKHILSKMDRVHYQLSSKNESNGTDCKLKDCFPCTRMQGVNDVMVCWCYVIECIPRKRRRIQYIT